MRHILAIGALAFAASCATNPATGKSEISLVSESQEIEMGKQGAQETLSSMPLVADSNVQRYVRRVAMELVGVAERPNLPWNFYVLDDAAVNAFAYPGGFIFITRGILTHMNSEAELAGVLGHEIGHVTARHTASQITKQQLAQIGLVAGSVLSTTVAQMAGVASQGLGMLFMKFGRDAEYQADELGFRYMTKDGYDPRGMTSMFQMLQRQSAMGGAGRLPEWQSTHPDPENRVAKNEERLKTFQAASGHAQVESRRVPADDQRAHVRRRSAAGLLRGQRFLSPGPQVPLHLPAGLEDPESPGQRHRREPGAGRGGAARAGQGLAPAGAAAVPRPAGHQGRPDFDQPDQRAARRHRRISGPDRAGPARGIDLLRAAQRPDLPDPGLHHGAAVSGQGEFAAGIDPVAGTAHGCSPSSTCSRPRCGW